jgi:hypothetical protein
MVEVQTDSGVCARDTYPNDIEVPMRLMSGRIAIALLVYFITTSSTQHSKR